jgi:hypothetical protein
MLKFISLPIFWFLCSSVLFQWTKAPTKINARKSEVKEEYLAQKSAATTVQAEAKVPKFNFPSKGIYVVVDFSMPSNKKRLWVIKDKKILLNCRVAHGKNSGMIQTASFSNEPESFKSCYGNFISGNSYVGEKGLAMRIHGLDFGINHNAYRRGIVFHSGAYVSDAYLNRKGRIGRSLGCFVTEPKNNAKIIRWCRNRVRIFVLGNNC